MRDSHRQEPAGEARGRSGTRVLAIGAVLGVVFAGGIALARSTYQDAHPTLEPVAHTFEEPPVAQQVASPARRSSAPAQLAPDASWPSGDEFAAPDGHDAPHGLAAQLSEPAGWPQQPVGLPQQLAGPPQEPAGPPQPLEPFTSWPAADAPFQVEDALPESERVPKPKAVRGLYLNAWAAGSGRKVAELLALADTTEINTFVIDVKDATGYLSYRSAIPLAEALGSDRDVRVRHPRRLLAKLRKAGIYPIARIVVFKDPVLAARRPDLAIVKKDGALWKDHHGEIWVDAYNREVWDYNIAVAREAVDLGFSEIQWDYVRFPDVPRSYQLTAVYPARAGRDRQQAIREFLQYAHARLDSLHIPITADVFGITIASKTDVGIGQHWEDMSDVADVLLPMVYPSHFPPGSYGLADPNAAPYNIVHMAMEQAVERSADIPDAAAVRPWLQDFTLGPPVYDAPQVRAQIQAVYDAGLTEWILWNPGSRYSPGALVGRTGVPPYFPAWMPAPDVKVPTPQVRLQAGARAGAKLEEPRGSGAAVAPAGGRAPSAPLGPAAPGNSTAVTPPPR
ncbi:MAG: putative glycoside hydrolase [Gemmatimonadota bacterium]